MKLSAVRHSKNETPVWEVLTCFRCENKMGSLRIFVIFQDRPMFSHINEKLSPRPFEWYGWTWVYLEKRPKYALIPIFFQDIYLCSATSMKSSVREIISMMWLNWSRLGQKEKDWVAFYSSKSVPKNPLTISGRSNNEINVIHQLQ